MQPLGGNFISLDPNSGYACEQSVSTTADKGQRVEEGV